MKKLMIAFVIAVFSMANYAQAQTPEKMATKHTSAKHKATLHCYAMKDSTMMECWGTKGMPMTKDAVLKNGTKVSSTGEVTMVDGTKETLKAGQCILAKTGKITDFDEAHPKHKMADEKMK